MGCCQSEAKVRKANTTKQLTFADGKSPKSGKSSQSAKDLSEELLDPLQSGTDSVVTLTCVCGEVVRDDYVRCPSCGEPREKGQPPLPPPPLDVESKRKSIPDTVRAIMMLAQASRDQLEFFEDWTRTVFNAALRSPKAGKLLLVSTDLTFCEVRISGEAETMASLATLFSATVGTPGSDKMVRGLSDLQKELQMTTVTLWCRLKRMGSASPGVDAGFFAEQPLEWELVDLLMPPIDDADALREFAVQQKYIPSGYGSSILPIEPERSLRFTMDGDAPKKLLLPAILFFKCVGCGKPDDDVVRILGSGQPAGCLVNVAMGPKGLTRVSLRLTEPRTSIAQDLARCLSFAYRADGLEQVYASMGCTQPSFVEYVAEARGTTVAVGVEG